MNRYFITRMHGRIFSFLMQDDKAIEIHCDNEEEMSLLGNIYIGRVKNIAANLGAAFVEIGEGRTCYLPLTDLLHPIYTKKGGSPRLQAGDELLVQVSREAIKSKFPSVTTNLMFHGKYILLTTGKTQISASSKLERAEKERLTGLVRDLESNGEIFGCRESRSTEAPETAAHQERTEAPEAAAHRESTEAPEAAALPNRSFLREKPASAANSFFREGSRLCGWLLRTNAAGISRECLLADMRRQFTQYCTLVKTAPHRPAYSCVLRRPAAWITRISDLYREAAEQIVTDDPEIFRAAKEYLSSAQPEDLEKLVFYEDNLQPLAKRFSLERQLSLALSAKVWLNSGGYLVIQPTEALTVIDVNTGKYEGGKNREKAFRKINLEAAREAARQIRLRNLSGIILIDFINMESAEANEELLLYLDSELRRDPVRTVLVDMTRLSLVEITRQKKERPLAEDCPQNFSRCPDPQNFPGCPGSQNFSG